MNEFFNKAFIVVSSVIFFSILGCMEWQGESLGGIFAYNHDENPDDPLKKRSSLTNDEKTFVLERGGYCQKVFDMYKKWESSGDDADLKTWDLSGFTLVGNRPLNLTIKRLDVTRVKALSLGLSQQC